MNIIDAVRTGLPFRIKTSFDNSPWIYPCINAISGQLNGHFQTIGAYTGSYGLTDNYPKFRSYEILSNDWEIKNEEE